MRRIVVVGYEGTELLDLACVTSTLDIANRRMSEPQYQVQLVAPGGVSIECDSGLRVSCDHSLEDATGPVDTLVVLGGLGHAAAAADTHLVQHVQRLASVSRRVASVCTGAGILAACGLLNGRRATSHWRYLPELAHRYPDVVFVTDPVYVRDGRVVTSAGITAALDLTLALVQEDAGPDVCRAVARALVAHHHRSGDEAQITVHTAPDPEHDLVRGVIAHIRGNLDRRLDSRHLARVAGVSERHFHRLFLAHVGSQPARFVRRCRIEAAASMLTTTTLTVGSIATRCGFRSGEALRQAFIQQFDQSPSHYRRQRKTTA